MKPWYTSKTLWFNLLAMIIAIADSFGFGGFSADPSVLALAGGMVALVNIILRLATSQGVSL